MSSRLRAVIVSILLVTGVGMLLYPSAANWQSQIIHNQELQILRKNIDHPVGAAEQRLNLARTYNEQLTSYTGMVSASSNVPVLGDTQVTIDERIAYDDLMGGSDGIFARIMIPKIDVDLPVYKTVEDHVLLHGVGHLPGTALPVGGESTHSVLSAHRGLASSELFTNLDKLDVGDQFTVAVSGEVLTYEIRETLVVKPDENEYIRPQEGRDLITLVTCTPLGINTDRILVTAERITPTPIAAIEVAEQDHAIGFPWWIVGMGATVAACAIFVIRVSRQTRAAVTSLK